MDDSSEWVSSEENWCIGIRQEWNSYHGVSIMYIYNGIYSCALDVYVLVEEDCNREATVSVWRVHMREWRQGTIVIAGSSR